MRKNIAILIFGLSIFMLVTLPNIGLIRDHKAVLDTAYAYDGNVQKDEEITLVEVETFTNQIHNLLESKQLESKIFQLDQNKYSGIEIYELNMELEGSYINICSFIEEVNRQAGIELKELEITKASKGETKGSKEYFVTLKILFAGALE